MESNFLTEEGLRMWTLQCTAIFHTYLNQVSGRRAPRVKDEQEIPIPGSPWTVSLEAPKAGKAIGTGGKCVYGSHLSHTAAWWSNPRNPMRSPPSIHIPLLSGPVKGVYSGFPGLEKLHKPSKTFPARDWDLRTPLASGCSPNSNVINYRIAFPNS